MKFNPRKTHERVDLLRALFCLGLAVFMFGELSMRAEANSETNSIRILQIQGVAEIMPSGASTWVLTQTNQVLHPGDKLRTGNNSRVAVRWSDQSIVPFGALAEIEILSPDKADALAGLNLIKGVLSFFHRDKPGRIRILTHG